MACTTEQLIGSAAGLEPGTFDVDAAGQATYRIPIAVPPGVGGAQPSLALTYGHRQHNGPLGVGWSLSGLSVITRTKATYATDGFNGAVAYDDRDRLTLDGQRLINVQGGYGRPGTIYNTELQGWNKVVAGASPNDGFTVCTRNGEIREYGKTPDSLIFAPGSGNVRAWALNATIDRNGNRVEYRYTLGDDPADGAFYIASIRYNTRDDGMQPARAIDFAYERRPDPVSGFAGGYPMKLTRRMTAITVSFDGSIVRTYTLGYRLSNCTQLSCIASITESGAADQGSPSLPPVTLLWSDVDQPGFVISSTSMLDQHVGKPDVRPMNVRGSGRTDLVQLWTQDSELHATVYLAEFDGTNVTYNRVSDTKLGSFGDESQVLPCDLTGDGRTDLLVAFADGVARDLKLAAFLSNGTGFDDGGVFVTGDNWSTKHLQFFAMDVNGDGRTDLVEAFARFDPNQGDLLTFRSYLSKFGDGPGAMFTQAIQSDTDDPAILPNDLLAFWPMDVNGDGAIDLVRVRLRDTDNHVIADTYRSVSTSLDSCSFAPAVQSDLGAFTLEDLLAFLPVDVNGDGIQDLLQIWKQPTSGGVRLHFSTFFSNAGGGFIEGPDTVFEDQSIDQFHVMDLDGGGAPAIVSQWISGKDELMFTAYRSSPAGTFRAAPAFDAGPAGSAVTQARFYAADANGDGKADLLRLSPDQNDQIVVVPYLSAGPRPDVVTSITNPLGGVVTIDYKPLTDPSVYQPSASQSFPAVTPLRPASPIAPAQFPVAALFGQALSVVSSYVQRNDPSRNRFAYQYETRFTYAGAQIQLLGRGWQGFASVAQFDVEKGRRITRTFNQDFPLTGTLASTSVSSASPNVTVSVRSAQYTAFPRGKGVAGTQILEVLQTAILDRRFDPATGNFDYAQGQTFAYDDFGCLTTHVNLGYVDPVSRQPLDPAFVVYHYASFQNDVTADGWVLGNVRYSKDSANSTDANIGAFLPGDYRLRLRTYTGTYQLATDSKWDDTHGAWQTTSYGYDAYGNRTSETKPGGATTTTDFDPGFHTFRMRTTTPPDAAGHSLVTSYGFDPRFGAEAARQDPNGSVTITVLDAFGRKSAVQGPVPAGTRSDGNNVTRRVTGSPELRSLFQTAAVVTVEARSYLDDGAGGVFTQTSALQSFPTTADRDLLWNQSYSDGRKRERQTVRQTGQSAGNAVVRKDYDCDGSVVLETAPFFSASSIVNGTPYPTTTTYDVLRRPLTCSVPIGASGSGTSRTTWVYGTGGRVTMTTAAGTDAAMVQIIEHHDYDGHDKIRSLTLDPHGASAVTVFHYDPIARLIGSIDPPTAANPHGVPNVIVLDSLDRRRSFDTPDQNTTGDPNTKAQTLTYEAATGYLATSTDAAGGVTTFSWDALGRVTGKSLRDGRVIHYTYDDPALNGAGRLTRLSVAANGSTESQYDYGYDLYGNTSRVTLTIEGAAPFVTATTFDPQKRNVSETLPDGSNTLRTYRYGQLVSMTNGSARIDYPLEQMVPSEKPSSLSFGGGAATTSYTFNPLGQVYHEHVANGSGSIIDLDYAYDALNQLLSAGDEAAFTYVNRRLTSAAHGEQAAAYDYDASGNLIGKDGVTYTYQAHYPVSGSSGGNTVFSAAPDACGRTRTRTTNGRTLRFAYDGLDCLSLVSDDSGPLRELLSDANGNRIRERDPQRTVLYVSASYRVESDTSGTTKVMKVLFDPRGAVAEITTGGSATAVRYLRRDFKGSVTHVLDAAGAVVAQLAYDAYGLPRVVDGCSCAAGPKYEQRYWMADLGLYYFGARYYDPLTGRFLTPDTQLGSDNLLRPDVLNRFAFELNNPINAVDLTGHGDLELGLGIAIGALLILAAIALALTPGGQLGSAMIVGALFGGGLNAIIYSSTHRDVSGGQFWAGWAADVAVGVGIGAATAGLSYGIGAYAEAQGLSVMARVALYSTTGAALGASGDVLNQLASNGIDRDINHEEDDVSLDDGLGRAAATGAVGGAVAGLGQAGVEAYYLERRPLQQAIEMMPLYGAAGPAAAAPAVGRAFPPIVNNRAILFGIAYGSQTIDAVLEAKGY